jgi:Uncharacterized conserved protein
MAFGVAVAAALSGASPGQLEHWRRQPVRGGRAVLVPEVSAERPLLYSFRDVMALRTCVYLRERVSLQKIRRAIANLNELGFAEHLSHYRLVATEDDSVAMVGPDHAVDLVRHPGQQIIAEMSDVLAPFFVSKRAIEVPDFWQPRPQLTVNAAVRGGHPVVSGTRVPYELVAGLVADGVPPEQIREFYPSVSTEGARDADDFARYVEQVEHAA